MRQLLILTYVVVIAACHGHPAQSVQPQPKPQPQVVLKRWVIGIDGDRHSGRIVVRDSAEWQGRWFNLTGATVPPPVDFRKGVALIVSRGLQRTEGYDIQVDTVYVERDTLVAVVSLVRPCRGAMLRDTYYWEAVEITGGRWPVQFVDREVSGCIWRQRYDSGRPFE